MHMGQPLQTKVTMQKAVNKTHKWGQPRPAKTKIELFEAKRGSADVSSSNLTISERSKQKSRSPVKVHTSGFKSKIAGQKNIFVQQMPLDTM